MNDAKGNINKGKTIMGLTNSEVSKLNELIFKASDEQLSAAVDIFKMARSKNAAVAASNLRVGAHVEWTGKRGRKSGVVTKILRKNIEIETDSGERWRVPASMVESRAAALI